MSDLKALCILACIALLGACPGELPAGYPAVSDGGKKDSTGQVNDTSIPVLEDQGTPLQKDQGGALEDGKTSAPDLAISDQGTPPKPDAKSTTACGSKPTCDDNNSCTVDSCVSNTCKYKLPIPSTCGNGVIEGCELCDTSGSLGHDVQICLACTSIGHSYQMYLIPNYMTGNAYYSVQTDSLARKLTVTCNKPNMGVVWFGGNCESNEVMYLSQGKLYDKSVTITCNKIGGANNSTYAFRCGYPP